MIIFTTFLSIFYHEPNLRLSKFTLSMCLKISECKSKYMAPKSIEICRVIPTNSSSISSKGLNASTLSPIWITEHKIVGIDSLNNISKVKYYRYYERMNLTILVWQLNSLFRALSSLIGWGFDPKIGRYQQYKRLLKELYSSLKVNRFYRVSSMA